MNTPLPMKTASRDDGDMIIDVLAEGRAFISEQLGRASLESVHAAMLQALVTQYRARPFAPNLRPHVGRLLRALAEYVEADDGAVAEIVVRVDALRLAYIAQLQANDVDTKN